MNVIAHSLLPVVLKQAWELKHAPGLEYRDQVKGWIIIGISGTLPDILDPHLTIGSRYDSYSHTWPFTSALALACLVSYVLVRRTWYGRIFPWCALAYLLHVAGDIVSGGIDFLLTGHALGDWWITPELWPVLDLLFLTAFVLIHRKIRRQHGLDPSVVRQFLR
ncbi:MAG TPA: hypothetical protein DET40_21580 [Lentisphaeria bacterium]|nr:MAG: hypothetical protein A2X45_03490 [Lentisphaerae bacterium GWF2_50_93]HCE46144.1 hypothetical protein [Lentisphaeria bacterium]